MKKLNYLLLGAAGLLMASCSQNNDVEAPQPGEGNFRITVNVPELAGTRSFGDGFTANNLHYAVYDADNNYRFVSEGFTNFPTDELWTTVDFQLAYGKNYVIVFFAQSAVSEANKAYTFDAEDHYVYVDYSKMADYNQDYYDCFFRAYETGMLTNETQDATITLYRPVAQVNWGVSDMDAEMVTHSGAYGENAQYLVSSVSTETYTIFDMLLTNDDDEVVGGPTGATKEISLPLMARPAASEAFPYEPTQYEYVSMQYLLVPAESSTLDLTLTISNQGTAANPNPDAETRTMNVVVPNAPVQANYRTNIFGDLLTGDLNFKIVKEPAFNTPDYDVPVPGE